MDLDMARAQLEYEIPDDDTDAEGHRMLFDPWVQLGMLTGMLTGKLYELWMSEEAGG